MGISKTVLEGFDDAAATLAAFREDEQAMAGVQRFVELATKTLQEGGRLFSCGNGGSMCDAMHFAEEWTGRFRKNRKALPATAFSDPGALSCIANDFGYDQVFARSLEALGRSGDLLVVFSTSGKSPNVLHAIDTAREMGIATVGLLGKGGGPAQDRVDVPIVVPRATWSDRIQELHIKIVHIVIEEVERTLFPENYT